MSGYLGSLSDRQQAALDQFRNAVEDVRRATDTDAFLLRWLRARDFDVTKAEKMYRHHLEWRKENGLDDILHSYEMPELVKENFPGAFLHPGKDGRLVWICPMGLEIHAFLQLLTPSVVRSHIVYLMEESEFIKRDSSSKTGKEIHSHYFVADMDKLRLRQVYSWQVLKAAGYTLHLMEDQYPECVEKFIVINAPSFFPMLWKFLRTLMTQRTADKFEVYGKEDGWKERLLEIVDAEILPAHWGGNMLGPDGDPMCRHKVNYGGRFEEGATTASYDSVFDEKDAQQQTIGRRDRWELPVDVAEAGARLNWRFQTAAGDLAFGLRNHCGQSLVPLQRLGACSLVPQEGTWHCVTPGTYVLEFDNTYSWLNDKTLAYIVNVDYPEKFP
ncbi:SEC14-like protein 2 [Dermacentor andersoni]|uniref:SEC14-like protein 2 n=1 Tax=Dermacentor andersoni TaxID=34620 RepID=UPI002155DAC9|nr:SEC14-like protein 2 isoform X3 [Dermacentor andersoni]